MSTGGIILVIVFVVAMMIGPIVALKTVSHIRMKRGVKLRPPPPDDENDPDKPTGFW